LNPQATVRRRLHSVLLWWKKFSYGFGMKSFRLPETPAIFALVALGGFGRRSLFPHSDVDILFLHADRSTEALLRDPIRNYCQEL